MFDKNNFGLRFDPDMHSILLIYDWIFEAKLSSTLTIFYVVEYEIDIIHVSRPYHGIFGVQEFRYHSDIKDTLALAIS